MIKFVSFLFILLTLSAKADTRFYDEVGLGETDLPLYAGPLNPQMQYQISNGKLNFSDEIFKRKYLAPMTSAAVYDWEETWFDDLRTQAACPNSYLAQNVDYIRYLYRLLTLSYLYESLKDYQETLYGLGQSSQACSLSYDVLFSKCKPAGEEMKKFVMRAKAVVTKDMSERALGRFDAKSRNNWLARVRNTREDLTPAQGRVRGWCEGGGADCDSLKESQVVKALTQSCNQEKNLFIQICSEEDAILGLSQLPQLASVLASSNVLKVINEGGHGEACLTRYAHLLALRERWHPPLAWIMPAVRSKLAFGEARYPQGVLFVPGALREFDERGLSNFLFVEPTPLATATPAPIVAILPRPTPAPTPIILPKPDVKPPVIVVTPKPTPTPKPLSAFEYAVQVHLNGRDPIDVDMARFSREGRFGAKIVAKLREPLKQYQTRQALQDMKKGDKLGTFSQPIRLMFLKFLIDQDQHQGLWNIINVIGESFYVVNDLEGRKIPVWAHLRNDRSTNYTWQITIEEPPPAEPPKK